MKGVQPFSLLDILNLYKTLPVYHPAYVYVPFSEVNNIQLWADDKMVSVAAKASLRAEMKVVLKGMSKEARCSFVHFAISSLSFSVLSSFIVSLLLLCIVSFSIYPFLFHVARAEQSQSLVRWPLRRFSLRNISLQHLQSYIDRSYQHTQTHLFWSLWGVFLHYTF